MQIQVKEHSQRSRPLLVLALVIFTILSVVNFKFFYVGFISSDDAIYVASARALVDQEHYLPTKHWGFRYTVLLPIAALEGLVANPSEVAYSLIPLVFAVALGIAVVVFIWANVGAAAAVVSGLLMSTMPLIVVYSSIMGPDLIEALFLFLSLALFFSAIRAQPVHRARQLFLSGLALGGALITRETAYGFLIVYGLLFLWGAYFSRKNYLWTMVAAVLIVGVEMTYYMAHGESPLYRLYTIARSHGTVGLRTGDFQSGTSRVTNNRWLAPITALLMNQEFVLLFLAAGAALVWLKRERCSTWSDNQILRLFLFAALVFFIWLGYGGAIRPLTRYYALVAVIAVIPIAIFFQRTRFRSVAYLTIAGLVFSNYMALAVANLYPRFAGKQAYALAAAEQQPVFTDPDTASRARQYAEFLRSPSRNLITSELPSTERFTLVQVVGGENQEVAALKPLDAAKAIGTAQLVKEIEPPKLLIGRILDLIGLACLLSESQYRWLAIRNPELQVFHVARVPQEATR